jgi:hypothetical protein
MVSHHCQLAPADLYKHRQLRQTQMVCLLLPFSRIENQTLLAVSPRTPPFGVLRQDQSELRIDAETTRSCEMEILAMESAQVSIQQLERVAS